VGGSKEVAPVSKVKLAEGVMEPVEGLAMPTLSLVLPTYNERANLADAIARIVKALDRTAYSFEIIVVDDDSPDETWKLAETLAGGDARIRILRRRGERGLATAVVAGWQLARGRVLGVMDADLQYPPETLPTLLAALEECAADVAICSRYAPGASVTSWSLARWIVSRGARVVGRLLLPRALGRVADPGAGYFVVRRRVIDGTDLRPLGFKILIEVLARGHYADVVEVGLPYEGRQRGQSKFRTRQVAEYLTHLSRLAVDTGEAARSMRHLGSSFGAITLGLGLMWALATFTDLNHLVGAAVAAESTLIAVFASKEVLVRPRSNGGVWARILAWHKRWAPGTATGLLMLAILSAVSSMSYLSSIALTIPAVLLVNYATNAQRQPTETAKLIAGASL
jgi:dolichol-phosphate mannosyltransferase